MTIEITTPPGGRLTQDAAGNLTSRAPTQATGGASERGSHQLASVFECPRRWLLRTHYGYIAKANPPYRIGGTLIHLALAHFHAQRMTVIPDAFKPPLETLLAKDGRGFSTAVQVARGVHAAYGRWFSAQAWHIESVEVEYRATVRDIIAIVRARLSGAIADELERHVEALGLSQDEFFTARLDLVIRINGKLYPVDIKSVNSRAGSLPALSDKGEYGLHWQSFIQRYCLQTNYLTDDIGSNIILRASRDTPHQFAHDPLTIRTRAYAEAAFTIFSAMARERELQRAVASGQKLPAHFWSCYTRGPCDYRDYCQADSAEARKSVLETDFTRNAG